MVDAGLRDLGSQEPITVAVDTTASETTVVASTAGKRIAVVYWSLGADAARTIRFQSTQSDVAGKQLTGKIRLNTTQSNSGWNPDGHFMPAAGELLNLEISGGTVSGYICYIVI